MVCKDLIKLYDLKTVGDVTLEDLINQPYVEAKLFIELYQKELSPELKRKLERK